MEDKIDFVITWVDSNDKKWLETKNEYEEKEKGNKKLDKRIVRYRDMECLKYWFRGVEKFAPWVNNIYFTFAFKVSNISEIFSISPPGSITIVSFVFSSWTI